MSKKVSKKAAELAKARDRVRALSATVAKAVGALRVERAALPLTAGVFKEQHRQAIEAKARTAALNAYKTAAEEAATLTAPLAMLRAIESEAEQRRLSREEVLTEHWVRSARHVATYEPREFVFDATDHRPVYSDRLVNELRNAQEQDRAQRAELTNAVHELRDALTLPRLSAAELARRVTAAAAAGDAATLNALWQEHEGRQYASADQRNAVSVAMRQAIQAIELPEDLVEELAVLDELADADAELHGLHAEIATGAESPAAKVRLVRELGEQGFMDRQRQAADELRTAAQARAAQMVRNSAAELVQEQQPTAA